MSELRNMERTLRRERREAEKEYERAVKALQERVTAEAKAYKELHR